MLARAVQGLGAGGLLSLSLAVIGAIVPPRERGRWQGLIGSVFASASIIGPAVGGFIVDTMSWRWVFLVNLPIGGLALVVIAVTMPRKAVRSRHSIDWLGAGVLAAGTASLLLALVWAGHEFAWTSSHVLGAFVAAAVLLAVFAAVERRAPEPILPFEVLRNPIVAGSVGCMAFVGMTMFGLITYVPLFVQGVIGTSATSSGVVLTPLMLGAVTTSLVTGQLISRTGRYRWNVLLGPLVLCVGTVLLWRMDVDTTEPAGGVCDGDRRDRHRLDDAGLRPVGPERGRAGADRVGHGADPVLALDRVDDRGRVMGLIVNAGLPADATLGEGVAIHRLPLALRDDLAAALKPAFGLAVAVTLVVWVIAAVWVKEVPLRRTVDEVAVAEASAATPPVGAD